MTAKTPAERKADERKRRADEGLAEVRGIWAYPADHAAIKSHAARLTAQTARKRKKERSE